MIGAGEATRLYRVLWVRCDPRTGEATGPRGVLFPGPLTHAEACTCVQKTTEYPWRYLLLEEIEANRKAQRKEAAADRKRKRLADGGAS